MSNPQWFVNALSSDKITKMTGGRIQPLSREAAAGLVGGWIVETGDPTLSNLDVVEVGNGNAGRGLSQYTHSRRGPYDRARSKALAMGQDVNSREWQLAYFAEEYLGKHDGGGGSLIGWTGALDRNLPQAGTPEQYAAHFTDHYFRPRTPHLDRRQAAARELFDAEPPNIPPSPKTQAASEMLKQMPGGDVQAPEPAQVNSPQGGQVRQFGQEAVLNGNPVQWGGDDYGWQSPESFKSIEPPKVQDNDKFLGLF